MKRAIIASAAAFAICGSTSLVFAQGAPAPKAEPAAPPAGAPAPQSAPAAPAPKAGPAAQDAPRAPAQVEEKSQPKAPPARPQDKADTKPDTRPDVKAPAPKAGVEPKGVEPKPAGASPQPPNADNKPGAKPPSADNNSGSAGAAPAAAPPAEKRTQITSVIKQEQVKEVTNVNFNISIGTRVPSTVAYSPLPARVIEIYPEWRGYYFILVKGRYLILRPETYEIVYIIEG